MGTQVFQAFEQPGAEFLFTSLQYARPNYGSWCWLYDWMRTLSCELYCLRNGSSHRYQKGQRSEVEMLILLFQFQMGLN
jgi:hypothetical protein